MSSEFTFGYNFDYFYFRVFFKKKNFVDRDLTEYLITQTLALSRLHAHLEQAILCVACSEQTSATKLFTRAQRADLKQTREIRLFN